MKTIENLKNLNESLTDQNENLRKLAKSLNQQHADKMKVKDEQILKLEEDIQNLNDLVGKDSEVLFDFQATNTVF